MDMLARLPVELGLQLVEYLGPEDLTRCLGVSTSWRHIVNKDTLWRPFCLQLGLEESALNIPSDDPLQLCQWASIYITYMNQLLRNWISASYSTFLLPKEDWYCCIAGHRNIIAVYYPRNSLVRIYKLQNELILIQTIIVTIQNGLSIPDLFVVDEDTIIICRGSVVLVYKKTKMNDRFGLYKCIVKTQEGLSVSDGLTTPWAEGQRKLYVKVITDRYLWVEDNTLYVVDLYLNSYKNLNGTYRCLRSNGKEVFAANNFLSVFSPSGDHLYCLDSENVEDLWVSSELVVLLIPVEEGQILEVYSLRLKQLVNVVPVKKDPVVSIRKNGKQVFILEVIDTQYSIQCLDSDKGIIGWSFESSFPMELQVHPELHVISERFLLARPTPVSNCNFILLDAKTGHVMYDSAMPPCLSPPCYIYCLTDRVFITAESSLIHIRSYL